MESLYAIKKMNAFIISTIVFLCAIFNSGTAHTINKNKPKTLVLIICSDNLPVYEGLQKVWRSYMHLYPESFECYFIRGNPLLPTKFYIEQDVIWSKTQESLTPGLLNKTLLSLEALLPRLDEFSYVLRTNLSSFFVLPNLLDFLIKAPSQRFYAGIHHGHGFPGHEAGWVCGAGIIMSTDLAKMLVSNSSRFFDLSPENPFNVDDVAIADYFAENKIPIQASRFREIYSLQDWINTKQNIPTDVFHFRIITPPPTRLEVDLSIHKTLLEFFYNKTVLF